MICLNTSMWVDAQCQALKVDFLETREEFRLYAESVYQAMLWGEKSKEKEEVDEEEDMKITVFPNDNKIIRAWVRREGRECWAVTYKVQGDATRYVYDERVTRLAAAYRLAEMIESPDFLQRLIEKKKKEMKKKYFNEQ